MSGSLRAPCKAASQDVDSAGIWLSRSAVNAQTVSIKGALRERRPAIEKELISRRLAAFNSPAAMAAPANATRDDDTVDGDLHQRFPRSRSRLQPEARVSTQPTRPHGHTKLLFATETWPISPAKLLFPPNTLVSLTNAPPTAVPTVM